MYIDKSSIHENYSIVKIYSKIHVLKGRDLFNLFKSLLSKCHCQDQESLLSRCRVRWGQAQDKEERKVKKRKGLDWQIWTRQTSFRSTQVKVSASNLNMVHSIYSLVIINMLLNWLFDLNESSFVYSIIYCM